MSVAENIFIGQRVGPQKFVNYNLMHEKAAEIFKQLGADIDTHAMVGELSTAQQPAGRNCQGCFPQCQSVVYG